MRTSILDAIEDPSRWARAGIVPSRRARAGIVCPACGSANVAQVLGDNGGVSYVCTACGHSWS
ncbi:hypothetical protein VT50_0219760 [Streptomyces antioxidans]|uniref:Transposase zinc-ribbon domain-containing protein n=1 Tax=Streptomyces antioxidans TaxID=1507734 RepID=A0A1V4D2L4_9ACTN|nr:hypothetical protein [Streptomyces antioxidans]OPF78081.1 hypothetical protein VT50_0219760 [Streptomyces antioxidans]